MFKIFRIICCVICAALLAAIVFIFIYAGWQWGVLTLIIAAAFFGLTVLFKNLQEKEEQKLNPPPPVGDFITGRVENNESEEE
ncbi:MAG: hypothetical protein J6B04_00090 [Clostridia bacterium]|nr:hypothetical protein [Clostridia bacterium]